jgi:hypothetical protein
MKLTTAIGLCLLLNNLPARAGEVIDHNIEFKDEHYVMDLDMRIEGGMPQVYAIILDFNNLTLLNDTIKLSEVVFSQNKVHTVRLESEGCVLFFCKQIKQIQLVTELGDGKIQSFTDPDESDLIFGAVQWQLTAEEGNTRIHYHSDYVPGFWVPPVIGPAIFKSRLLEEALKTVNGIEQRVKSLRHDQFAGPR